MFVSIDQLETKAVIYKINYNNGKIYIGRTNNLRRRISEHINNWKKSKIKKVPECDIAIHEIGIKNNEIEILEFIEDLNILDNRERYWIQYYNSNNPEIGYNQTPGGNATSNFGEDHFNTHLSNKEIYDIRKRRYNEERKKDVYKDYKDKISFGGFEKIWLGVTSPNIGEEFIIPANSISRAEYSSKANAGLRNGRAKCSYEEIIKMRYLFDVEHKKIAEIHRLFSHLSVNTVRRVVLRETFKDIE